MPRRIGHARVATMLAAVAMAAVAMAAVTGGPVRAAGADALGPPLAEMRVACAQAPAAVCAGRAAALFDGNRDGGLSPGEIAAAQERLRTAAQAEGSALNEQERLLVAVALATLERAGPDAVFARFDANRDGKLDRAELFADFRLDKRPFAVLVTDPRAVDWQAFAARFGETGKLFLPLLPVAGGGAR